jgi:hypothetical protein
MKLRGHVSNSVIDLYNPRIGLLIWLQQNRQTDLWEYLTTQRYIQYMNVEIGRQNIINLIWK